MISNFSITRAILNIVLLSAHVTGIRRPLKDFVRFADTVKEFLAKRTFDSR